MYQRVYNFTRTNHLEVIASLEGVADVRCDDRAYSFTYHNGEDSAANLLRELIRREIPVASFVEVKASLEEVYLQTGLKQVD